MEKSFVASGIELENLRAELKTLCPFRPAAAGVAAVHGEDGSTISGVERLGEGADLAGRMLE